MLDKNYMTEYKMPEICCFSMGCIQLRLKRKGRAGGALSRGRRRCDLLNETMMRIGVTRL